MEKEDVVNEGRLMAATADDDIVPQDASAYTRSGGNEPLIIADSSGDEGFHVSFPGDIDLSLPGLVQGVQGQMEEDELKPHTPNSPKGGITSTLSFGGQPSEKDNRLPMTTSPGVSPGSRAGVTTRMGRGGGRGRGRGVAVSPETMHVGSSATAVENGASSGDCSKGSGSSSPRKSSLSSPRKPEPPPKLLGSSPSPTSKHISFATHSSPLTSGGLSDHPPSYFVGLPVVPGRTQYETLSVPLSKVMPHFDTPAHPLVSIPLTSPLPKEFNAVLVSCASCTKFSVVPLSIETKQALKKIAEFGAEVDHVPLCMSEITIGSKCGLKTDDEFYRVNVEKLLQGDREEVLVYRIDFGGVDIVTCDKLVTLSEDVVALPSARRSCTILSLMGEFSRESAEFLLSLVENKPIRVKNHGSKIIRNNPNIRFTLCDITTVDGKSNLSEVIAASQYITKGSIKPPYGMVSSELSLMGGGEGKDASTASPTTGFHGGFKRKPSNIPARPSPGGQYKIVHYAKKVPKHQPQGTTFEIVPTVVNSPQSIWAQVVHENIHYLHRMLDDMNAIYSKGEDPNAAALPYVPEIGEVCAAKFPVDHRFYRAEILCVNHNGTVDVRNLDFGNRETLLMSQLQNLHPVFLTLPQQALFFLMADISPRRSSTWSDGAMAFLCEKIMNRKVKVETVRGDSTKAYIYNPDSPNELLNDALVKLGHADRLPSNPPQPRSPKSPLLPMPGVNISEHRNTEGLLPHPTQSPTLPQPFPPGKQSEPTSIGELRLPLDLSPSPYRAPGKPREEQPVPANLSGPPTLVSPEKSHQDGGIGSPFAATSPQPAEAPELGIGGGRSISDISDARLKTPASFSSAPSSSFTSSKRKIETVKLSESSGQLVAMVSHVENPLSFYIQVIDKSSLEALLECTNSINQMPLVQNTSPGSGELCVCRYSEDGSFYRGRVTSLLSSDQAKVHFIDYGNTEVVTVTDIYEIDEQFLSPPAQAVLCTLNQLLNPNGRGEPWKEEAVEFFKEQVSKRETVEVTVVKVLGVKNVIEVCVSTEGGERDLLDLMVSRGYGGSVTRRQEWNSPRKTGERSPQKPQFGHDSQPQSSSPFAAMRGGKEQGKPTSLQGSGAGGGSALSPFARMRESGKQEPSRTSDGSSQGTATDAQPSPFRRMRDQGGRDREQGDRHGMKRHDPGSESPETKSPFGGGFSGKSRTPSNEGKSRDSSDSVTRPFRAKGNERASLPRSEQKSPFASIREQNREGIQGAMDDKRRQEDRRREHFQSPRLPSNASEVSQQPSSQPQSQWPTVTDLQTMEIPSDSVYFEVVVSEIEHPGLLFLHIASLPSQQALSKVTGGLNAHFQSNPPATLSLTQLLAKGTVCCAKFSEDDMWYRAEILDSPSQSSYRVRFFDFGNTDTVALPSIAPCPETFLATPIMAVRCALNGIGPPPQARQASPGSKTSRAAEAKAFLKANYTNKQLLAKVVESSRPGGSDGSDKAKPLPIELVDTSSSEDIDVAGDLVKRGLAVRRSSTATAKLTDSPQIPKPAMSNRGAESSTSKPSPPSFRGGQQLTDSPQIPKPAMSNRGAESITSKPSPSFRGGQQGTGASHVQAHPVLKTTVPQTHLPVGSPSEPFFKVTVTDVSNPTSFWVQRSERDSLTRLNSLMEELQKTYSDPSKFSAFSPDIGSFCCAKYAADNCWYRAKVVALRGNNTATVCYIDFGNMAEICTDQLFTLDPQFSSLPSLAVHCSLAGIQPAPSTTWASEAVQAFSTIVQGDGLSQITLNAEVVQGQMSEGGSQPVQLDLYLDEHGVQSVAMAIVERGFAAVVQSASATTESPPDSTVPTTLPIPVVKLPSSSEFFVMITHVESLCEMYFQVANKEDITSLLQLMEVIHSYSASAKGFSPSQPPQVGELCLAQFTDRSWYRALVLQGGGGTYKVYFIDFGNSSQVEIRQMQPISDKFMSVPAQAVKAGLYGVPAHEVTNASSTVLDSFKSLVNDSVLTCKVVCNSPFLVELKNVQSGVSIRDDLVQSGLFPHIEDLGLTTLPSNRLPLQGTCTVVVTEAKGPGDFWVQVLDLKALTELEKLTQKIEEHCRSSAPLQDLPVLGQLCCAQFSEDMAWYRGRVTAVLPDGKLKVHFVDFGNCECTALASLRLFKRDFTHIPSQAVHCCLLGFDEGAGVAKDRETGEAEVCQQFKSLVGLGVNRQLVAFNRGVGGGGSRLTIVELVDTSGSEDMFVHKSLKV